uniref:Uncharacterized protein n=1 Tax=Pyrodinium bahamense TaxID=73915 RepID=A0A7S0AE03_9DINO
MDGLGVSVLLDELEANFSPDMSPTRNARRPPPPSACSAAGEALPPRAPESPTSDFISELCRELEHEKQQRVKERERERCGDATMVPGPTVRRLRFEELPEADSSEGCCGASREPEVFSARRAAEQAPGSVAFGTTAFKATAFGATTVQRPSSAVDKLIVEGHALLAPGATGFVGPIVAGNQCYDEEQAANFGSTCDSSLSGLLDGSFFQ